MNRSQLNISLVLLVVLCSFLLGEANGQLSYQNDWQPGKRSTDSSPEKMLYLTVPPKVSWHGDIFTVLCCNEFNLIPNSFLQCQLRIQLKCSLVICGCGFYSIVCLMQKDPTTSDTRHQRPTQLHLNHLKSYVSLVHFIWFAKLLKATRWLRVHYDLTFFLQNQQRKLNTSIVLSLLNSIYLLIYQLTYLIIHLLPLDTCDYKGWSSCQLLTTAGHKRLKLINSSGYSFIFIQPTDSEKCDTQKGNASRWNCIKFTLSLQMAVSCVSNINLKSHFQLGINCI